MPEKTLEELRKIAAKKAENPHTNNLRIKLLHKKFNKTLTNRASSLPPNTIVNSFDEKKKKPHKATQKKPHKATQKRIPGKNFLTAKNMSEIREESAKLKAQRPEFKVIGDNKKNSRKDEKEFRVIGANNTNKNSQEEFTIIE
jgi:hypothetical protein